jgi:mannitol/fructose-specific phosphotransferase system IIA component (Ntr-type)
VPDGSVVSLKAADKFAAFDELLDAVHKARPVFPKEQAREFIINREKLMSCALIKGVAFPHARVGALNAPMVALGISKKGIFFNAGDGDPVKLIFLILTPFKEPAAQLKLLAELAAVSSNKVICGRLLRAKSGAEVAEILLAFENIVPD